MLALLLLKLLRRFPNRLLGANVEVVGKARIHKLRPKTSDAHLSITLPNGFWWLLGLFSSEFRRDRKSVV